jgi:hypothetical protein
MQKHKKRLKFIHIIKKLKIWKKIRYVSKTSTGILERRFSIAATVCIGKSTE